MEITAHHLTTGVSGTYWTIRDNGHRIGHVVQQGYSYTCLDRNLDKHVEIDPEWIKAVVEAKNRQNRHPMDTVFRDLTR